MALNRLLASLVLAFAAVACEAPNTASQAAQPPPQTQPTLPDAGLQVAQASPPERRAPASQREMLTSLAPVAREASPSVVNIRAQRVTTTLMADPFFGRFGQFFGVPREQVSQSIGSGVIVRGDGVIVTNNHVVDGATELVVTLSDRREFGAQVLLADPRTDLAVLRINSGSERLPAMTFADTRAAEVGDLVLAIGSPFGLQQTVTSGIISALARSEVGVADYSFFIQTDASINRGNSGGALVDMQGNLLGINTAIFSTTGGSAGIGFAIPSEMVRRVVEAAVTEGKLVRPWLGVRGQPVTADLARSLGLDRPQGVLIADLYNGGPADRAGLKRGDVILTLNETEVFDEAGLRFQTGTQRAGARLPVVYLRGESRRNATITIDVPPDTPAPDPRVIDGPNPFAGARVLALSPAAAEEAGLDPFVTGVLVEGAARRSPASRFFGPGDLILVVNGEPIRTTADLQQAATAGQGRGWAVQFERRGQRQEIAINP